MEEREFTERQKRLWAIHDFGAGTGLEIGPLHHAAVPRAYADVRYLDVFDRDTLLKNYADHAQVDPDQIPAVDYPLFDGERVRSIPEAVGEETRFDWVMASHVVEHVPDVVGWLQQIAAVTVDGARLVLAVPDRRFCFDVHRPGTTTGQLLEAHERGDTVPSIRAVYDYKRGHAVTTARDTWAGRYPGYDRRIYSLEHVLEQVDLARRGEYVDSHVWTFTPGSFVEQVVELRRLGLSQWAVETLVPTARKQNEFYVVLRRLPRDGEWPAELFAGEPEVAERLPDWLEDQAMLRAEVVRLRKEVKRANKRVGRLEQRIDDLRGSWRWRVGGSVVGPVSALRRAAGGAGRNGR